MHNYASDDCFYAQHQQNSIKPIKRTLKDFSKSKFFEKIIGLNEKVKRTCTFYNFIV